MAVPSALEITMSIRRSETKVSDVVAAALVRVEAAQNLYNAFTLIRTKEAQEEARFLDKLEQNARGPLHGVPIAIKEPSRVMPNADWYKGPRTTDCGQIPALFVD